MASSSNGFDWHQLKVQARSLESKLEQQLQTYSRFNASFGEAAGGGGDIEVGAGAGAAGDDTAMARGIEQTLAELLSVNDKMNRCAATSRTKASSAMLKRYREILHDYKTEFRTIQASITRKKESAELFRDLHSGRRGRGSNTQMDALLRERSALSGAHRAADEAIESALDTSDRLRGDRTLIGSAGGKVTNLASRFPIINTVIDAINKKRSRNNVVIALVIAACICFTIWYLIPASTSTAAAAATDASADGGGA